MVSHPRTDEQKGTPTSFTAAAKETAVFMLENTGSSIRSQISLRGRVQFFGGGFFGLLFPPLTQRIRLLNRSKHTHTHPECNYMFFYSKRSALNHAPTPSNCWVDAFNMIDCEQFGPAVLSALTVCLLYGNTSETTNRLWTPPQPSCVTHYCYFRFQCRQTNKAGWCTQAPDLPARTHPHGLLLNMKPMSVFGVRGGHRPIFSIQAWKRLTSQAQQLPSLFS